MIRLVGLDSGPLGLLTHPKPTPIANECSAWLWKLLANDIQIALPDIADYELRREYLLRGNEISLQKLESLRNFTNYLLLSDTALKDAAELWAQVRGAGKPTADPKALDADCLVVAQIRESAKSLGFMDDEFVIATTDLGDLPRLAPAARWTDINI